MIRRLLSLIALISLGSISVIGQVDTSNVLKDIPQPKFRFSISGGMGNLIGATSDNIQQAFIPYVEELKSGTHYGADLSWYLSEHKGLGIKYSVFLTDNELKNIFITDSLGNTTYGNLRDDITNHYLGLALALRQTMPRGNAHLVSNLSMGMITYFNDATVIEQFRISGSAFAFSGDVGLDFELDANFYFGINLGLTLGIIRKLKIESDGETELLDLSGLEFTNAGRVDLGIGLKYYIR